MQIVLEVDIATMAFNSADGERLTALKDLRFDCASDTFTSIVGPSGCGKTTTLRCILGLETNFEGRVLVAGRDVSVSDTSMVSAVFQEPRILPWRTVEQNVLLAMPDDVKASLLDELFEELGLSAHRHFYPAELSLGLARRVSIARAFATRPELLILDEPFVSLDDETANRLRKLLIRVWSARACTALMVTHNLHEAIELSDRILFYSGAPSRVVLDYSIDLPRDKRDEEAVAMIKKDIALQRPNKLQE